MRITIFRGLFQGGVEISDLDHEDMPQIQGTSLEYEVRHHDTKKLLSRSADYRGPGELFEKSPDGEWQRLTTGDPYRDATLYDYEVRVEPTKESEQRRALIEKGYRSKSKLTAHAAGKMTDDERSWFNEGREQQLELKKRKKNQDDDRRENPTHGKGGHERADGVLIKGDEVSFIEVGDGDPNDREIVAYRKRRKFGKGKQDYLTDTVLAHDPSGRLFPACSVYVVKRAAGGAVAGASCPASDSATEKYYPGTTVDCGRPLVKPKGPWQRVGEIDGIRYRRWWDEHGNGNYRFVPFEHPFDPPVVLFRCSNAYRLQLPRGCILDDRGFVYP